jgi:Novel STAND NTPase 3
MSASDNTLSILSATAAYPLHLLGWKAFQDLCVGVAEECLRRPVQIFLPNNDAGRDGAFVGRWEAADPAAGESTIQCKFTSRSNHNLSLSILSDELEKARSLAAKGMAADYIILTNHPVTGASELEIRTAFEAVGVGRCRVFGYDWIVYQIRCSPRLRIMAPRLYGLGDLSDLLDARAYAQAQLILSAMGDSLQRLVVTEAHRRSVRAISAYNLVLLLGAPASGKSTIGASLAIGAADIWKSGTIRAMSPEDVRRHINPGTSQFFWIDDAWGSTQYQRQTAETWNQVFPLMQGAIKSGTRFLITSRDYIWRAAQNDLKLQALPVLKRSQVIINVLELSAQEKAQILYNHLKLGDQPKEFLAAIKPHLPEIVERSDFLPETARRLGSRFFAGNLRTSRASVTRFFESPEEFLLETIANLAADCRGAIAVVFMNGGRVRSPISADELEPAAAAFGVSGAAVREQLEALNGSLLLLAKDEDGPFWTYKHPTVSDAFAAYVARSPELVEVYLRGAKPDSIIYEVVCSGGVVQAAPVIVPSSLHELLAERIQNLEGWELSTFLSYRSNRKFSELMLKRRPDVLERLHGFSIPIKDDTDASLAATLHRQGLLPEEIRLSIVEEIWGAAVHWADASFIDDSSIGALLTEEEKDQILTYVEEEVLSRITDHVQRVREEWGRDYPPDDHFDNFQRSLKLFAGELSWKKDYSGAITAASKEIAYAVARMNEEYEPSSPTSAPTQSSTPQSTPLMNLFRDVDE